jgi:hypothetical protein
MFVRNTLKIFFFAKTSIFKEKSLKSLKPFFGAFLKVAQLTPFENFNFGFVLINRFLRH